MGTEQNQDKSKSAKLVILIMCMIFFSGCGKFENDNQNDPGKKNTNAFYSAFLNIGISSDSQTERYDMKVYLDNEILEEMEYGGSKSYTKNLKYGTHKITFMKNNDRAVFGTTYFFVGMEAQKIEISAQGHRRYIDISITSYK